MGNNSEVRAHHVLQNTLPRIEKRRRETVITVNHKNKEKKLSRKCPEV